MTEFTGVAGADTDAPATCGGSAGAVGDGDGVVSAGAVGVGDTAIAVTGCVFVTATGAAVDGEAKYCTTYVAGWPSYIPSATPTPICVYTGLTIFSRWVGDCIHASTTSFESIKRTAKFSPA